MFGLFIGAVGLGQVSDIILLISTMSDYFGKCPNTFQSSFHALLLPTCCHPLTKSVNNLIHSSEMRNWRE